MEAHRLLRRQGSHIFYTLCSQIGSRKLRLTAMGIRCADNATPYIGKSWHELRRHAAVARSV
jgi:hypothetical protein